MDLNISALMVANQSCILERQFLAVHPSQEGRVDRDNTSCPPQVGEGLQFWAGLLYAKRDEGGTGNSRTGVKHTRSFYWVFLFSLFPGPPRNSFFAPVHFHKHLSCLRGSCTDREHPWPSGPAALHQGLEAAVT